MSHERLVEMARRSLAHAEAGTVDQAAEVMRIPARNYVDPERYEREREQIFGRLPLVLGFSAELRKAGDYRAFHAGDTPVLLVRGKDGRVRGFLNVCSHRGAIVVPDGAGCQRRFVCPYHAWAYDDQGALVGVYNEGDFGDVDRATHGLTEIAVEERAGLVFGCLDPERPLGLDAFLQGYDEMLEHLGLASCHVVGRQAIEGPNWKIAYDGYLDFYHLPVLHKESFGTKIPSDALYDAWGTHQRVHMPNPALAKFKDRPDAEWEKAALVPGVWTVFPHISIADFDAGGKLYMVSQLFPGPSVDSSITIQNFLATDAPDDARQEKIDAMIAFLRGVVRDEDYFTGKRVQRGLATGAKREVLFGRNEAGGQRFHRYVEALLGAEDEALPALFEKGIDP